MSMIKNGSWLPYSAIPTISLSFYHYVLWVITHYFMRWDHQNAKNHYSATANDFDNVFQGFTG